MANVFTRYGVGIDMSKDTFHACIGGLTSVYDFKVIAQRKFKNNAAGFREFMTWVKKHMKSKNLPWQAFVEVTGVYHEGLLYTLHKAGFPVSLQLGKRVKNYLKVIGLKSKTDKLDGKGIAQMACERKGELWEPVSEEIMKIRAMIRHRKALMNSKNQLQSQLHAIQHTAVKHGQVIRSLKKVIRTLSQQIEQVETNTYKMAKSDKAFYSRVKQIVDSVKGLGLISVLTVVAETNGFKSFNSISQLTSYAGFDVVENSSGKHVGKTRISKRGNVHIRASMHMPSVTIVGCKISPFYQLYERLVKRNGGIKMKAMVAVQRKLLTIIYTLWKKEEAFDLTYYQAAA